jgi:hypothetical protein
VLVAAPIIESVLLVLAVGWAGVRARRRRVATGRFRKWRRLRSGLSDQERRVLELRYGLYDGRPHTLEEVALAFDLTQARIREIENRTLMKLQALEEDPRLVADAPTAPPLPPPSPDPWPLEARFWELIGRAIRPGDYPNDPEGEDGLGVREPRRPRPSGLSGGVALRPPEPELVS